MSDDAHPGKMHLYNRRGYCWCGVHRDDGLAEAICEVLKKREPEPEQPAATPAEGEQFERGGGK